MDLTGLVSGFVTMGPMSVITLMMITTVSYKYNQLIRSLKDLHVKNSESLSVLQGQVVTVEKEIIAIKVRDETVESFITELRGDMTEVYKKLEEVRVELVKR